MGSGYTLASRCQHHLVAACDEFAARPLSMELEHLLKGRDNAGSCRLGADMENGQQRHPALLINVRMRKSDGWTEDEDPQFR